MKLLIGASLLVALVGAMVWIFWPDRPADESPRARQYRDVNACLLTDERGVADESAAPVWAGMQEASLATGVRVEYLSVVGEQTGANAATFLASLAQGRCAVVFAVGAVPVAGVKESAARFPQTRFVVVGGDVPGAANVSSVAGSPSGAVTVAVSRAVADVRAG